MLAGATRAALIAGWNAFTCSASRSYAAGGATYVYALNTDGSFFYWLQNNPLVGNQTELQFACQHGAYSVYITNPTTGAFNQVQVNYR